MQDLPPSDPGDPWRRSPAPMLRHRRALVTVYLVVVALVYGLAYLGFGERAGNSQHALGWWGWWDQSQYLRSARALAAGDLRPAEHWYPLGYPLLAAPFLRIASEHAFFVVNAASFVAVAWLLLGLGRWAGIGAAGGVACFFVGVLASRVVLAQWVIPWTTTPVAALYLALFALHARACESGFRLRRLALLALGVCVVTAIRPVDAFPLLPLVLHTAWCVARSAGPPIRWRLLALRVATPVASAAVVVVAYGCLHVSLYGFEPSPYMEHSRFVGLQPAIVPFRFFVIFGDPRPFFGHGAGLLERFPLVIVGLWGLVHATLFVPPLRVMAGAVWISLLTYLAYADFLPSAIWRFYLVHYWKWTFPALALLAGASSVRVVATRSWAKALLALAVVVPIASSTLHADEVPTAGVQRVDARVLEIETPERRRVAAVAIRGIEGDGYAVLHGDHSLLLDGARLRHLRDFRMVREEDVVHLVLHRPREASAMRLELDPSLVLAADVAVAVRVPRLGVRRSWRWRRTDADRSVHWDWPGGPGRP